MRIQIVDHEVNDIGTGVLSSDILEHLGKGWPLPVWRCFDEVTPRKRLNSTKNVGGPSTDVLVVLDRQIAGSNCRAFTF
jgi:hypothetical protein